MKHRSVSSKGDPGRARAAGRRALGADVGATLAKLALREDGGPPEFRLVPGDAIERVAREVEAAGCDRVGVTGGGAAELAARLGCRPIALNEFDAWRAGAAALLAEAGVEASERYLLVSLGTGCSALLIDGARATRVGGTALGGGTLVGLGRALLGDTDFARLVALARRGDRRRVDLLVSDVYRAGEAPLPGDLNAASFAKLARGGEPPPQPCDLAHALMGLVGENVGLICAGLAKALGVRRVVFGGTTLRENETGARARLPAPRRVHRRSRRPRAGRWERSRAEKLIASAGLW